MTTRRGRTEKLNILWLAAAALSTGFSLLWFTYGRSGTQRLPMQQAMLLSGLLSGNSKQAWTLVEFGDVECPACRKLYPDVERLVSAHRDKLAFSFRHMILKSHGFGWEAAAACEDARFSGDFDVCREHFFSTPLSSNDIKAWRIRYYPRLSGAQQIQAAQRVSTDMKVGGRLGIDAIPALFLVNKDGRVYRIRSLDQIANLI